MSRSARYAAIGHGESPSGPRTSVVMPCEIWVSARGSVASPSVEWLWTSMNPGARTSFSPRITRSPSLGASFPTSAIRSPSTRTSSVTSGAPVPSATRAPAIRKVCDAGGSGAAARTARPARPTKLRQNLIPPFCHRSRETGNRELEVEPEPFYRPWRFMSASTARTSATSLPYCFGGAVAANFSSAARAFFQSFIWPATRPML